MQCLCLVQETVTLGIPTMMTFTTVSVCCGNTHERVDPCYQGRIPRQIHMNHVEGRVSLRGAGCVYSG